MIIDYFFLAFRNLRKRGIRSWLTLLGIFIGVMLVISLISLGNGLQMAVMSQFGVSSTQVITVQAGSPGYSVPGGSATNPLKKRDVDAIENLGEVEVAIPRNIETIKMEFNGKTMFTAAGSIPEGRKRNYVYELLDLKAEKGRLLKSGDSKKVILGHNFLDGEKNGFGKPIVPGKKVLINGQEFRVVGILEKKGSFLFDNLVAIGDNDLNELAGYGDNVDIIAVKIKSKDLMDKAKENIEKLMRERRGVKKGEEDFTVQTPQAILKTVNSIIGGVNAFIVILAFISIVVGAVGITNTMTTSVLERKKEIGIMKAIGAKNKDVFLEFFVESGLLGVIGGIIGAIAGAILGYVGTAQINKLMGLHIKPEINLFLIFFTICGSFLIGSLAGIIPAMQASKQNPVESLRG